MNDVESLRRAALDARLHRDLGTALELERIADERERDLSADEDQG